MSAVFLGYEAKHRPTVKAQFCYLRVTLVPGAPLTYFNDGGGGGPKDFFGSDILGKRDFLGSMKDAGIFLGRENNTGIFWGIVFFISSNQQ